MSSFDNFYNRLQTLNEARKSPVEALVPGATGVTKQMRSAGLSSAPLDTIRFIRELLYNLDVIGDEELAMVKSGKGFTGKKQAMLKVLQDNQDAINAKSDEIAQTIENTLDNFISGMGVNRSREEKYAAQAAAQELAAQARAAKSGKEMDDALADVISDEKLVIKASLAKVIQELEDLPGGEDISPDVLEEIKKFAPKINTIEQLESFVKQLSAMEEYQLPAAYLSSTVKAIKGGMEDIEMEDQEDPDHGFDANKSDLDKDGKISEYERKRGEAIASSMSKEDNEDAADGAMAGIKAKERLNYIDNIVSTYEGKDLDWYKKVLFKNPKFKDGDLTDYELDVLERAIQSSEDNEGDIEGMAQVEVEELGDGELPDDYYDHDDDEDAEGDVKKEVLAAIKAGAGEFAHKNAGLATSAQELAAQYEEAGDKERSSIANSLAQYFNTQSKFDSKTENEEVVAESKYTTADYITDMYSSVKPIVESTIDENGQTTPTEKYLVEHAERAIEEAYTNMYLTEQKAQDSLPKQKKEKSLSFKERFQPKTHWQLEEVRRYGL